MSATGSATHGEIKVDVASGTVILYDDIKLLAQRREGRPAARVLLPTVQHHSIPANREQLRIDFQFYVNVNPGMTIDDDIPKSPGR